MITKVIYASQTGAKLNSNVYGGGGTDDTAILQQTLDLAKTDGGVHLIMDGAALVTGLVVHSNTTITCLNRVCGFYLADHANQAILINAHPSPTKIFDRNITLIGGTYNQNCLHQVHHLPEDVHYTKAERFVVGISFFGVENLLIRDFTIRNFRTFAFLITNWRLVTMENILLELPDYIPFANQDGIHIQGPGQYLTLRNIRGCTGDDFIALNGDEESNGETSWFHPAASVGPMSDILVDTVMVDDAAQVVRILSRDHSQDRITVRNVSGVYRSFGFYLSAWDYKHRGFQGEFGHILFENINLRQSKQEYTYTAPFLFRISGRHKSIHLKNIYYYDPADSRYILFVEGKSDIPDIGDTPAVVESLVMDGLHIQDDSAQSPQQCPYIQVAGHVKNMVIRNSEVYATGQSRPVPFLAVDGEFGKIDKLTLCHLQCDNVAMVVDDKNSAIGKVENNPA
jgi:hypothetical protein